MSRHSYSSFTRRRLPLLLALLTVFSTFTEHVTASPSVDKYLFNKRERVHSRLHSRDISTWDPLLRRADDPYSCSADRPCSNGACCGKDGWCGYAPEYCGDGCLANCDAKAECGEYAEVPGATCPINVCCSEFGFCGTTEEFCGTGCQNGCEQPGPGAAWGGDVRDIVIGYYEAWTAGAAGCGGSVVDNIPVQGLTHLFFSFGFIEPDTYNIIPMPGIAESAFSDVVNTKQRNPDLKVYIALGGWTHNDNGTIWQPVFSDLVSTQAKRTKFINGLLTFLAKWGFDGVDFDWEYPGAGDRGGQEDDGVNFTTMLKELKAAISAGSKNYGVTFTAPTSFWYLQHFDLEAMMQYVDWMNMMSYDLHGEWDAQNPIGARVLAHTNLTEINLALNLMWRNNVPPSQIVMGFGFYGRTFTLGDASCTQPGCAFVAGGAAGPCTGTAGYLSYKEILQILDTTDAYTTYDEVNAVKYFTYDSVNWVSFDDQVTLKQKVDFASSLGLRGMMIWAIDLDDDSHTALQSLVYPRALDWAYSGSPASSISSGSSTPTSVAVPGPTQAGVTTSCSKYHVATATDYCYLIWTTYGITGAQFYAWNPSTGSDPTGADCSVWLNYAYCVGVSTSTAGATSGVVSTSVASGNTAGATSGVVSSVASGNTAGATSGVVSSVASGNTAGATSGVVSSVASGNTAGATSGAATSVASGNTAGATAGAGTSVASGNTAGATSGAATSVASGNTAGATAGAGTSVASGVTAGATSGAGGTSVASGNTAGATAGAGTSVGTGNAAGGTSGANDGATGVGAGGTSGATSVATGVAAGGTTGAGTSVATGVAAGGTTGAGTSVATGVAAGGTTGAGTSVAAGGTTGATSVATGVAAGGTTGAGTSVATGNAAGGTSAAATSSTPTSGAAAPGATQAGTTSSCTKWHLVGTGDYCYSIWQTYGITGAQFYAWNTGTGTDASGSDCSVWFDYAYCVGV